MGVDSSGKPISYPGEGSRTAMDWEVCPEALYDLLVRVHKDYAPTALYITENGAAYDDVLLGGKVHDLERVDYLRRHFATASQSLEAGVPLKGFYVWSLLDNFEWAFGYERRFGLIYVDFETQERIMKSSALWYQKFLASQRA
mgnify:FL=1